MLLGVLDILGFEIVGEVIDVGSVVKCFKCGDVVCVFVIGGGYVEYVVVDYWVIMMFLKGFGVVEVVVMLEMFMMVWFNFF